MWTKIEPAELVSEVSPLDTMFFSSILSNTPALDKILKRRSDKVITGDLFSALYDWNPQLKEEAPDEALKAYIQRMMGTQQFEELRSKTKGDQFAATGGAVRLYRELMRPTQSDFKAVREAKGFEETASISYSNQQAKDVISAPIKAMNQALADSIKSKQLDGPGQFELNRYGRMSRTSESQQVTESMSKVSEDLSNMEELSQFNGGVGLDPNDRGERLLSTLLDEQLIGLVTGQDKLRGILKVAGRMKLILEGAKSKKPVRSPKSDTYTYGNDLDRVSVGELAMLADDELEVLFYLNYAESKLQIRDNKARESQGMGPFIACVDVSDSMSGWREEHGMALFVSMARLAVRQKRKVIFMPFASSHEVVEIDSAVSIVRALTKNYKIGYSTHFQPVIDKALGIIEHSKVYAKADVLIVSDGEASVSSEWASKVKQSKDKLGCRMFGISVNEDEWPTEMNEIWDARACMSSEGRMSNLDWLCNVVERLV